MPLGRTGLISVYKQTVDTITLTHQLNTIFFYFLFLNRRRRDVGKAGEYRDEFNFSIRV